MTEKRILIVEDDAIPRKRLQEFLTSEGFNVEIARDGGEAMNKYNETSPQLVITDIGMPIMDGNELIGHLNSFELPPVIIVTTGNKVPELIIDIMKKGVYDYILKPFDLHDLLLKVTRAFEAYNLKRVFEITQREKVIRLENTLAWYRFEDKMKSRDMKTMGTNIFESLLTSFNQGSGFGSLVSLMSLMKATALKEGKFYKIEDELFDIIMDNLGSAEKALQTFGDMINIISMEHESGKHSLSDLHDEISGKIKEIESRVMLRKHHVMLSEKKSFFYDFYTEINAGYFNKAIEEILINSLKFSPEGSDIMILFRKQGNLCIISVINDIVVNDMGLMGIPMGYENLVFEPFFRLTKLVYDKYKTLDYGLGLTLTQKIINKYGGTLAVSNINDYSDIKAGAKIKVECSISLPVTGEKEIKVEH